CGSAKRMRAISPAENTKDNVFSTNTTSRPKYAASTPPTAKPITKLKDQVVELSALAAATSSGWTMFGITALRPGSKKAHSTVSRNSSRYISQTSEGWRI